MSTAAEPSVSLSSAAEIVPILRTEKLVKIYGGRAVVNGVDINIHAGEIVGVLGPNGAGKPRRLTWSSGWSAPTGGGSFSATRT